MVTMRELHNAVVFIVVVFSTEWSSQRSGLLDGVVILREFDGSSTIKDMVNMEA